MSPHRAHMSIQEVAEYLRISTATAYVLLRTGKLPGVKRGKDWRVSRDALFRFCTDNSNKSTLVLTPPHSVALKHAALELRNRKRPYSTR